MEDFETEIPINIIKLRVSLKDIKKHKKNIFYTRNGLYKWEYKKLIYMGYNPKNAVIIYLNMAMSDRIPKSILKAIENNYDFIDLYEMWVIIKKE